MDPQAPLALLGGLTPQAFMRRHWHKRPLLVRQALPDVQPPVTLARLRELTARDDVESRLVVQTEGQWRLRRGPLPARAWPPRSRPGWTVLVQGLDLHDEAAHELLSRFRFLPQARLDDLMLSYATQGGGVGPHLDSYDVFLLQVHGRRRWRIGQPVDETFIEGLPLKVLKRFEPEQEWVLEPGDLLYLPPHWAHDGQAVGECMTVSIGFRAPTDHELASELLARLADQAPGTSARRYRDPAQGATAQPGEIPHQLTRFAAQAVVQAMSAPRALAVALGETLTEPKPSVWFDEGAVWRGGGVRLDRRSRMMYDDRHVFLNGESFRAAGRDAQSMRRLADEGRLGADQVKRLSREARELMTQWVADGWLREIEDERD
jgi:50S ribosomal protein L16 3-hydroxylase